MIKRVLRYCAKGFAASRSLIVSRVSHQQESKENGAVSAPKESDSLCLRRRNVGEGREDRKSWMDPPEEPKTVTLTQAEIESCMKTYEVGDALLVARK